VTCGSSSGTATVSVEGPLGEEGTHFIIIISKLYFLIMESKYLKG
jgi:hypothetical protein